MLVAAVCVIGAILTGILSVPKWFVLLNPFVFLLVGVGLRKLKPDLFYDLPGIILPSLGMGMYEMCIRDRAGTKAGNKGYDCALGAIEMVNLINEIEA